MKKLLRISDSFENKYKDDLIEATKFIEGIKVDFVFTGDIFYDIDGKFKFLEKAKKEKNLEDFENYDLYWLGNKKAKDLNLCLKYFLNLKNKKLIDKGNIFKAGGKSGSAIYFNEKNIKTPKTLFFTNGKTQDFDRIKENIEIVESRFSYPFIAKYPNLSRGEGVFLIKDTLNFENFLKNSKEFESILIQEFIENKGDFRVIVTKKSFIGAIKRYNDTDFKNNISAGGSSEVASEIPEIVKEISIKIANDLNLDLLGIDYFIEGEKYKIIEINPGPQYNGFIKATGINLCIELLKYFKEL